MTWTLFAQMVVPSLSSVAVPALLIFLWKRVVKPFLVEALRELDPNGGNTMRARIEEIAQAQRARIEELAVAQKREFDGLRDADVALRDDIAQLANTMQSIEQRLTNLENIDPFTRSKIVEELIVELPDNLQRAIRLITSRQPGTATGGV